MTTTWAKPGEATADYIQDRARAGDGQFAIAWAILQLETIKVDLGDDVTIALCSIAEQKGERKA